ncbi:MAG: CoA transferase [Thermodesulfobacteriota bacterium]|nr:CoA transferase [Thermodesulfobacteriota bacterium]
MKQPLEGIRVVECGVFHAGPGCAAILGDLGAEVIKIEEPGGGDPLRPSMKIGGISFEIEGGRSIFFDGANRNKKSVTLDLNTARGQEIGHRLVSQSDVFITNMRRKAVEGMNMTSPVLRKVNQGLIYASVSAFGPEGPDSDRGGFDFQGQARSGFMYSMGEAGMPPIVCQLAIIDQATAIMASHQVITALFMRERSGIGQDVHVSILGTATFLLYFNILVSQMAGFPVPRHTRSQGHPMRNHYLCADGRWLMMTLSPPDRHWPSLCLALGRPGLKDDPHFDTEDARWANAEKLVSIFDDIFATRPCDEWIRIFAEYDLFCCAVNSWNDLGDDPQIIENGYIVDFEHPTLGKVKIPGYPGHFSECRAETKSVAPELGEHTDEVLMEIGGYDDKEIARLKEDGII